MLAEQVIKSLHKWCAYPHRVGLPVGTPWERGDIAEDEPVGSPEWNATLDSPVLLTFMVEANGRTLRVMVEDITAKEEGEVDAPGVPAHQEGG